MNLNKRQKILIAEDNEYAAISKKNSLEKHGYDIIISDNLRKVSGIIETSRSVDMALIDINFLSSSESYDTIFKMAEKSEFPLVFLISHDDSALMKKSEKITSYGYIDKNSTETVLAASIKMAFRLFEAEVKEKTPAFYEPEINYKIPAENSNAKNALIESEEMFKEIFENSLDNIFVIDVFPGRFKIKKINRAQEKLIKMDRKEVEGRFIDEVLTNELAAPLFEKYTHCVDNGVNYCYDEVIELFKERIYYSTNLVPLFDNAGKVFRIIGISRNITESKKAELALKESESKYRLLIEHSSDLIWQMDADTTVTYASPSWKRVTGYEPQSFIGDYLQPMIHPDDIPFCMEHLKSLMKHKNISSSIQYRFLHSDGSWHWHSANTMPVFDSDGVFVSVVGVSRDITDQKLAEEKIKSLLSEKEFILKEVHHRIKNNMHTISGLLSFQSNLSADAATRENLADASGRIRSMMVLYDKLYCSEDNSSISIKEYIPTLANEIVAIFSKNAPLKIQTQIEDIVLDVNILTPLGIIINELISNAVKHAFNGCDDRIINISAFKKENRMSIIFKDNGTGISDSTSFKNSSGFGLQLIQMLVKQMKGTISIENQNGTCFNMEFNL